jgi:hypothetical protein
MIAQLRQKFTSLLILAMLAASLFLLHPSPGTALHSPQLAMRCGCASATQSPFVRFKTT